MNPIALLRVLGSCLGAGPLVERLLFASLELAVLGLVMAVLIRVGRVRSPRLICLLWLLVLVKPLVSLSVGSPVAIAHVDASFPSAAVVAEHAVAPTGPGVTERSNVPAGIGIDDDRATERAASVSGEPADSTEGVASFSGRESESAARANSFANTSLVDALVAVWLAGVLLGLWTYLIARVRLHRFNRAASPAPMPVASLYRTLAAQLDLRRAPRLLVTDSLESPAIIGLLRPTILLPAWLVTEGDARKLDWAMRHELTHWRWLDPLAVFIRDVVTILFWFHPAVWWAGRRLIEAMELACDRAMVRTVSDAADYAEQLFGIMQNLRDRRRPTVAGGLFATRTQVGNRIAALLDGSFACSPQLSVISTLGVMVLAGVALAVGVAAPTVAVKGTSDSPSGAERILHFSEDRSLGMLFALDASIEREFWADGFGYTIDSPDMRWEYLGEAKGDVAVPAGKRVRLQLNEPSGNDLSPLAKLAPDDLYELYLGKTATSRALPPIAHLSGLKVLGFPISYPDDEKLPRFSARGLGQLATLTSLERLRAPNGLTDAGLAAIADALPQLKSLCFGSNQVTDAGLAAITKLRSLEEITIGGGRFTNAGLARLAELPALHYVWLWGSDETLAGRVTDDALVQIRKVSALRTLKLPAIIADAGLAHLAGHPRLEHLWLYDSKVTDAGLVHLKSMPSLKALNLGKRNFDRKNPPITDAGTVHLKDIQSLEDLRLPGDGVTDAGLANLAQLGNLKRLELPMPSYLDPKDYLEPYTDEGLEAMAKLRSLEYLSVAGPGVTDAALSHIARLTNLRVLHLFGCPITDEGLAKLSALKFLEKFIMMGGSGPYAPRVTVSGLNHLDGLPQLSFIQVYDLTRDERVLNISGLTGLEYLMVSCAKGSALRDEDLACLANLKQLRWFQAGGDRTLQVLTDAGLAHLAGLTAMERLVIGGAGVTDGGLSSLANMHRLDSLNVTGNFTDEGLRRLEGLTSLRYLWVYSGNNFSPAAKERLRKSLPNLFSFTADADRAVSSAATETSKKRTRPAPDPSPNASHDANLKRPQSGTPAPDFTVTTLDGKTFSLSKQRGKVVVLHFWATWCSPCVVGIPGMKTFEKDLQKKYGDRVVVVKLAMDDTDAKMRGLVEAHKWSGPHARIGMQSRLAADYGVEGAPDDFMIGPDGCILLNRESPEGPEDTKAVIDKALTAAR